MKIWNGYKDSMKIEGKGRENMTESGLLIFFGILILVVVIVAVIAVVSAVTSAIGAISHKDIEEEE